MFVDQMLCSDNLHELAKALSLAQGELENATKSSSNSFFKDAAGKASKYADLAEVLDVSRPVLSKYGLSVTQILGYDETIGCVLVTTRLMHSSGQWLQGCLKLPIAKKDPQGVGAGCTYGRRYSLAAIIGIAQEDDDGNEASSAPKAKTGSKSQTQVQTTSAIVEAMRARFDAVLGPQHAAEFKLLTDEYTSLTPNEQTQVLGAAKAARTRLDAAKLPPAA